MPVNRIPLAAGERVNAWGRGMLALYRKIWSVTGPAQIVLIVLSVLVAALAAPPSTTRRKSSMASPGR
jgi:hypothetical protein